MPDQPQIAAPFRKYVSSSFALQPDPYYASIQSAIDSILDTSVPWGIYVYPGEYNESVSLKSNISLIGVGIHDVVIKGNGVSPTIA